SPSAGDVAVLDFGDERRLNPSGLWSPDRLRQLRFGADYRVELFPDPTGNRARPAGADLANVDQVPSLLLRQVQRGHPARVFHEAYERKLRPLPSSPGRCGLRPSSLPRLGGSSG